MGPAGGPGWEGNHGFPSAVVAVVMDVTSPSPQPGLPPGRLRPEAGPAR